MKFDLTKRVSTFEDKETGLKSLLGICSIGNGITFGGVRLLPFGTDKEAHRDALRLSEAMTHKLAMIDEPFGGSKMVVLEPKSGKNPEVLHLIGELIDSLEGRFITAIDFGFEAEDAIKIREKTKFILGFDGPGSLGASGITTALGAFAGMPIILEEAFDSSRIGGKVFAIQGLGSVGRKLAELLLEAGAFLKVSDTNQSRLAPFLGIKSVGIVDPEDILSVSSTVFCPCGPACVINPDTIPNLGSRVIAGVANCVLEAENRDDRLLKEKGILLAPDFVLNAGGVIQGIEERKGNSIQDAIDRLPIIPKNLRNVFREAKRCNSGTMSVAKGIARRRRAKITASKTPYNR
jgi:glutamate dehydrogenase/leucine dehydrogenase